MIGIIGNGFVGNAVIGERIKLNSSQTDIVSEKAPACPQFGPKTKINIGSPKKNKMVKGIMDKAAKSRSIRFKSGIIDFLLLYKSDALL